MQIYLAVCIVYMTQGLTYFRSWRCYGNNLMLTPVCVLWRHHFILNMLMSQWYLCIICNKTFPSKLHVKIAYLHKCMSMHHAMMTRHCRINRNSLQRKIVATLKYLQVKVLFICSRKMWVYPSLLCCAK